MEHLAFGVALFVLGAVLVGAAWLRHELVRDHRALGVAHARLQAEHEQQRATVAEQKALTTEHRDALYRVEKDLETAARVGGWKRYGQQ